MSDDGAFYPRHDAQRLSTGKPCSIVGATFDGDPFDGSAAVSDLAARHERLGWWLLAGFVGTGLLLEGLQGLKLDWYLDAGHPLRRELWRLGHAHGALIALVHLALAAHLRHHAQWRAAPVASACLTVASILLPVGFWLGGAGASEIDPGVGILLVPVGGLSLVAACVLVAARPSS